MSGEQTAFGNRLRQARERRDISLTAVSGATKIAQSLLAALERGDASNWPPGIYRRAFLREYAVAIGLPPESCVAEFVRLFPESDGGSAERMEVQDAGPLRLTLAPSRWSIGTVTRQTAAAALDAAAVLAAGTALSGVLGTPFWAVAAIVALAYYSLATLALGRSPMLWIINVARLRYADRAKSSVRMRPSSRDLLHIVTRPANVSKEPELSEVTPEVRKDRRIASL